MGERVPLLARTAASIAPASGHCLPHGTPMWKVRKQCPAFSIPLFDRGKQWHTDVLQVM